MVKLSKEIRDQLPVLKSDRAPIMLLQISARILDIDKATFTKFLSPKILEALHIVSVWPSEPLGVCLFHTTLSVTL